LGKGDEGAFRSNLPGPPRVCDVSPLWRAFRRTDGAAGAVSGVCPPPLPTPQQFIDRPASDPGPRGHTTAATSPVGSPHDAEAREATDPARTPRVSARQYRTSAAARRRTPQT